MYIHTFVYVYTHTCIYIYIHIYMYICVVYIYIHIYVYIYIYLFTCISYSLPEIMSPWGKLILRFFESTFWYQKNPNLQYQAGTKAAQQRMFYLHTHYVYIPIGPNGCWLERCTYIFTCILYLYKYVPKQLNPCNFRKDLGFTVAYIWFIVAVYIYGLNDTVAYIHSPNGFTVAYVLFIVEYIYVLNDTGAYIYGPNGFTVACIWFIVAYIYGPNDAVAYIYGPNGFTVAYVYISNGPNGCELVWGIYTYIYYLHIYIWSHIYYLHIYIWSQRTWARMRLICIQYICMYIYVFCICVCVYIHIYIHICVCVWEKI